MRPPGHIPSGLPRGPGHTELPFNRPLVTGSEAERLHEALERGYTGGNGPIGARCDRLLRKLTGAPKVLLTPSCTSALEMAALLSGVGPGDEVITPSFTFVSTANAFVLRGATPVFVDIEAETLGLDPGRVADAVTDQTRAVVPVHYGGGAARMDELTEIARDAGAMVIEDAAQGVCATYKGRALGGLGALGALSFHETKNLSCGEGGALLVNDPMLAERAEVVQEKGTDRVRFVRGKVRAYTWVDMGSSFLLSDLAAAVLEGQLERGEEITAARRVIWDAYHEAFRDAEVRGVLDRPHVPRHVRHNGHIYYLLVRNRRTRDELIARLRAQRIHAQFHYVPLHSSPAGRRYGRAAGDLLRSDEIANRLVRLPLWVGMTAADVDRVAGAVLAVLS
jgi:dTDP-4-amino-4,6-dideoxygalactose transaminase